MLAQRRRVPRDASVGARLLILVLVGVLPACGARRGETPPSPAPGATVGALPPPIGIPSGAQPLAIDPDGSVVRILVYRAGPLARLGHDHVISSAHETGYAWIGGTPGESGFEIRLSVADLVIDDPQARRAEGPGFAADVPEDARAGTRRNLLRAEVLDGTRHPQIVVRANGLEGDWERPSVAATVQLKDQVRTIDVPLTIQREPRAVLARGEFRLRQSEFGITPFSVAGGAIQVADEVGITFEIRAVAP